ncbi:hypothetical protein CCACVL1_11593 [Corchorus capsularis]|uniref:Uncharacterized protein n=1 Tax=Corchorus capsularis TaxID=210143 RepID=A0A1R3IKG3_COCAP|nr:hypothetical protein CCACVL1_11593 [Corchorus capsularis]
MKKIENLDNGRRKEGRRNRESD